MTKFGIDVSHYQKKIDWEKVKSQIDFAILRLGWIGNKHNHTIDDYFERNYNECKRLGIPVGVYIYNYCKTAETIKEGANWTLSKILDKTFELPIFLDMEDTSLEKLGKDNLTRLICEFNYTIEQNGFKAGVYANKYWFTNLLDKEVIKSRYKCWIAHYCNGNELYKDYFAWQNSSQGKINGIIGNVDTNYLYDEIPEEKIETKPLDIIANEVIDGLWENGEERKIKLENAGYIYKEVQNRVNELLREKTKYFPQCDSSFKSIVDALKSIGVDSSLGNRTKIANANGIQNYRGLAPQNNTLLKLLKDGKLKQ